MTIHPAFHGNKRNFISVPDWFGRIIKPGGKVRLLKPHKQAGKTGIYLWVKSVNGKWAMVVELDEGTIEYVLDASEWEKVTR